MVRTLGRKTASAVTMLSSTVAAVLRSTLDGCSRGACRVFPIAALHVATPRSPTAFLKSRTCNSDTSAMATKASARIIDGNSVAKEIRDEIAMEISRMKESTGDVPGLAVILVGDRKDSATYVQNKKIACESVGINSYEVHLPEGSSEQEILKYIDGFNNDPSVHGILVQLPLPLHLNEQNVLNAVCIEKDVDGLNPLNIGLLAMLDREPLFVPCTPKGCIELLHRYGVVIKGKRAVGGQSGSERDGRTRGPKKLAQKTKRSSREGFGERKITYVSETNSLFL